MDSTENAYGKRIVGVTGSTGVSTLRRLDRSGLPLLIARVVLGGLFVYMGTSKVSHPIEFLKQIRLYHMMPEDPPHFLTLTAIVLPWIELLTGVALILGIWLRGAALLIAVMLAVFTPAIFLRAWAIHNQTGTPFLAIQFDCGCGAGVVVTWKKLLENTGLFFLALYAMISSSRRFCLSFLFARPVP